MCSSDLVTRHFRFAAIQELLRAVDARVPATGEKLFAIHTLLLWHRFFGKESQRSMNTFQVHTKNYKVLWRGNSIE